jgi:hypothetical protein
VLSDRTWNGGHGHDDLSNWQDETFDVVIDKAAMDAMMAVERLEPKSNLAYWTKRGLCQHVCANPGSGWSLFCKYPWRKFALRLLRPTGLLPCRAEPRLTRTTLVCYLQTNTFSQTLPARVRRAQLLIDRTIRIRTRFGWSLSCRHGQTKDSPGRCLWSFPVCHGQNGTTVSRLHISILHIEYLLSRTTN